MKLGLMLYPTHGEADLAFHNILLRAKGIKQFNRHERWFVSETDHKIMLMSHEAHKVILAHKFDSIWVDDRVDLQQQVKGYGHTTLKVFLSQRGNPECTFSIGSSTMSRL